MLQFCLVLTIFGSELFDVNHWMITSHFLMISSVSKFPFQVIENTMLLFICCSMGNIWNTMKWVEKPKSMTLLLPTLYLTSLDVERFHKECGILFLRVNQANIDCLSHPSLISITQEVTWSKVNQTK